MSVLAFTGDYRKKRLLNSFSNSSRNGNNVKNNVDGGEDMGKYFTFNIDENYQIISN